VDEGGAMRLPVLCVFVLVGLAVVCALAGGCVTIRQVSCDNLSAQRGDIVTSRAQGIGVLHVIVPRSEELEDRALADLRAKGAVRNVRLRLTVRDFLLVVQLYEVHGQGETGGQ